MNIKIQKPFSVSEIGQRVNNEDAIYPHSEYVTVNDRLFLVCDGVGGSNKGEVASSVACESIQTYFQTFLEKEKVFDPAFIEKAVRYTEIRFDDYLKKNPDAKGMATTLSLLYINPESVFIAYAGDSRIYQFRNGKIIFKTEDHSLVNTMVKNGQIAPENAHKHPQKNVIYKAIQGSKVPVDVDIIKINNVLPDDLFFMCTDGVTEALSDEELCEIFLEKNSSEDKITIIKERCRYKARDNYSAYIIPIQEIEDMNVFKQAMTSFLYLFA
ncbi:MAG: protein phosphatase 2C domain-containing protein [Dysgonamonadaceae bacterium]|jgi:protein phosphatase|nr:protein phosphatase 2C domain-containing protein [Dysgonamonadaceae bacterium]